MPTNKQAKEELGVKRMLRIPAPTKQDSGQFYKSGSGPIMIGFEPNLSD
jgi:hypothetical protein